MVAARLAGRWHCRRGALLLAAQATRPVAVAGRHLDATNWRLTAAGLQQGGEEKKIGDAPGDASQQRKTPVDGRDRLASYDALACA